MIIRLPLKSDSYESYPTNELIVSEGYTKGTISLKISGSDREISVNCNQLRKALRALQTWADEEE